MTEPKRIVDEAASDLDVAMMRAAREEPLPPHLLGRALLSVGVVGAAVAAGSGAGALAAAGGASGAAGASSGAVAGGAAVSGAGSAAAGAAKAGGLLSALGTLSATTSIKWAGTIAIVGALGGGAAYVASGPGDAPRDLAAGHATAGAHLVAPSSPVAASSSPASSEATGGEGAHAEGVAVEPATAAEETQAGPSTETQAGPFTQPVVDDAPSAATAPGPKAAMVAASPAPAAGSPPSSSVHLGAEVASLDAARSRLRAGDPQGCLERLAAYRAAFPAGKLAAEADALRIEALVALGDQDGAEAALSTFKKEHPTSPHTERVDAVVGSKSGPASNP